MSQKIIRYLVLILAFFVFQGGHVSKAFGSWLESDPEKLKKTINHSYKDNRIGLDTLSENNLSELREDFFQFQLRPENNDWRSLPEGSDNLQWIQKKQKRLVSFLEGAEFDVLVLPLQEAGINYDKTSRMMAAYYVADDIRKNTSLNVIPVDYVQQLLGDNSYQFDDVNIHNLQKRYHIKQVVHLYLRADYQDKDRLFLIAALESENELQQVHRIHIDKPSDDVSLSTILSEKTPQLINVLFGLENNIKVEKSKDVGFFAFPDSLGDLTSKSSAIDKVAHLQLLGITTSETQRLQQRNRYFERSLLALRNVSEHLPKFKLLKARALFYLYRRPEAIKLISNPSSIEEKAFLSFMNGNVYDLERFYGQLKPNIFQAFSYIELKQLANSYSISNGEYFIDGLDNWSALLEQAANDNDKWSDYDNYYFFSSLKSLFSSFDHEYKKSNFKKLFKEFIINEYFSKNLLFDSTITSLLKKEKFKSCCNVNRLKITNFDILEYYRTLGEANILRELDKKINLQSVNTSTDDLFKEASVILDGDLKFLSLKVSSLANEIGNASSLNHPKLLKALMDNIDIIFANTTSSESFLGETYQAYTNYLAQYEVHFNRIYKPGASLNFNDWPSAMRVFSHSIRGSNYYEYSHDSISSIVHAYKWYLKNPEKDADGKDKASIILDEFNSRFQGHPHKTISLANFLEERGDENGAIALFKEAVKNQEPAWNIYYILGNKYLAVGEYNKAAETYKKFPGFTKNSTENRVRLSNYAYNSGSKLYWQGEYELAMPFYEIAANLKTGSGASMAASQRLAYLKSDFFAARKYAKLGAMRYASQYRYRDFIALNYILGFSDDAQALFSEIAPRSNEPYIWPSLFVGHRIKSTSLTQILDSFNEYFEKNNDHLSLLKRFVTLYLLTDSSLTDKDIILASTFLSIESTKSQDQQYAIYNPTKRNHTTSFAGFLDPQLQKKIQNNQFSSMKIASNETLCRNKENRICVSFNLSEKPNQYELFLRAYYNIRNQNYQFALDKFIEYDLYFPFNTGRKNNVLDVELLTYITRAAVKTNKSAEIKNYLDSEYVNHQSFDYFLSKAIIYSAEEKVQESIETLNKAFLRIPYTENRSIFPWYQLAEVCEWLFNETGDQRYIEMALQWMQDYQVIQPIYAWSYAFEAKYSSDELRKVRAIAIAEYLDPNSQWLSDVPNELKTKARKWMKNNNPFTFENQSIVEKGN